MGLDTPVTGTFTKSNSEVCYRIEPGLDQSYVFKVESEAEVWAALLNADAIQVAQSQEGDSSNPGFAYTFTDPGPHYLLVKSEEESNGAFSIAYEEGIGIEPLDNARELLFGQTVKGTIQSDNRESFNELITETGTDFNYPGNFYKFDGEAGDRITIDVFCSSINSSLDTYTILISPELSILEKDDDGGGNYNSRIEYQIDRTGTYYLFVHGRGEYGDASDHFYTVRVTKN